MGRLEMPPTATSTATITSQGCLVHFRKHHAEAVLGVGKGRCHGIFTKLYEKGQRKKEECRSWQLLEVGGVDDRERAV